MNLFLWNLLLAVVWALAVGHISLGNLVVGYVFGYIALWCAQPMFGHSSYFAKFWQALKFLILFLWDLLLSNFRVAYDVVTPKYHMHPAIIAVPLTAKTDFEITLLANLITLTPGTLALDVSEDRRVLYVHSMFGGDPETFRRSIKDGVERRLLELMR